MTGDGVMFRLCTLIAAYALVAAITDAAAQSGTVRLMEPSSEPATLAECQRTFGTRPLRVISKQNGTGTPWHHRVCTYP